MEGWIMGDIRTSSLISTNAAQIAETGVITSTLSESAEGSSQDGGTIDGILNSTIYSIITSTTTNTFDGGTI